MEVERKGREGVRRKEEGDKYSLFLASSPPPFFPSSASLFPFFLLSVHFSHSFQIHITNLISRPSHSTIYATMVLVPCRKLESVCEPLHENQAALPITHRLLWFQYFIVQLWSSCYAALEQSRCWILVLDSKWQNLKFSSRQDFDYLHQCCVYAWWRYSQSIMKS